MGLETSISPSQLRQRAGSMLTGPFRFSSQVIYRVQRTALPPFNIVMGHRRCTPSLPPYSSSPEAACNCRKVSSISGSGPGDMSCSHGFQRWGKTPPRAARKNMGVSSLRVRKPRNASPPEASADAPAYPLQGGVLKGNLKVGMELRVVCVTDTSRIKVVSKQRYK